MAENSTIRIGIIGLGYVGLPLAVEFGKKFTTLGFDLNAKRISELQSGIDVTREVETDELNQATLLEFSAEADSLADCTYFIVTVPTPIDTAKRPDLRPLQSASKTVGTFLKKGDIVIYESTVYPGATEEVCVPILEHISGLAFQSGLLLWLQSRTDKPRRPSASPLGHRQNHLGFDSRNR